MKLKDILAAAIDKSITYPEAKDELKKLQLPHEEFESYDNMLYKLLGGNEKIWKDPIFQLSSIPNEMYFLILQDCIQQVRQEKYSPEIAQNLYEDYMISPALMNYFLNEAISIVRMNTLKPEEIDAIGRAYYSALKIAEKQIRRKMPNLKNRPKPEVEVEEQSINAEQIGSIKFEEEY